MAGNEATTTFFAGCNFRVFRGRVGSAKINPQKLSIANVTFGEFCQTVFGYPHPSSIKVCFGGCFSVIRTLIQQHPIAFYKKLIPYVSHSRDPLEGHYLE